MGTTTILTRGAPVSVPIWHTMMDHLCNPPPERVARVLGISKRSVYRYNERGHAPRPGCLAIFWLTRWGRSAVNAQAINDAISAVGYVGGLERQVEQLKANGRPAGVDRRLRVGQRAPD